MSRTIWKYSLAITDTQTIEMPAGARLLTVQMQANVPCLWALVERVAPLETRVFQTFGTGHPADEAGKYIGTYQTGPLVFHVFEDEKSRISGIKVNY